MGLARLKNGRLLEEVEFSAFEVFLKSDQNLDYQQNKVTRPIAIVDLSAIRLPNLRSRVQDVLNILDSVTVGSFLSLVERTLNSLRYLE